MAKINVIGAFMRRYGLKMLYFLYVAYFMAFYTKILVEDVSHLPEPPTYSWFKTIWLGIYRINGMLLFLPSLAFAATYFLSRFPEVREGPDTDVKPGTVVERKQTLNGVHKNGINGTNGYKNGLTHSSLKDHLPCFIIRIITRGDYPELIKRNATFHINLIEKYCHCDRLEAHIVTEKPLGGDYKVGHGGKVREFVVPSSYRPENGTLAKARNMAYWVEATANDSDYPPSDKTWILTLDEDSFITDEFVTEFLHKFLPSGAHCSVSPTLLELPPTAGFFNGCEESFFVTLQAMQMWLEGALLKQTPLWFRGAAYVVRRDVDKEIGHAYQPELSITEDHVFGHYFNDSQYKIGYINGWNWEGGAPNLLGLIKQRGRWFRGHVYAFLYQKMSTERRIYCAVRFLLMYLVQAPLIACAIIGAFLICTGNGHLCLAAGVCSWPLDYLTSFAFATYFYSNIFGAWHIMSTRSAIFHTIAAITGAGVITTLTVHLAALLWTLISLADDFYHSRQRYEVTEKKVT